MKMERQYTFADQVCLGIDQVLRALSGVPTTTGRVYPGGRRSAEVLTAAEAKHAAGLMRVNHSGEVCAQALYQGQALASRGSSVGEKLRQAAIEEGDHLAWCNQRLVELGSHASYLNPVWYVGSFCIGLAAGMAGDRWSLGFVAETERQVVQHLERQMERLPEKDERSLRILEQMQVDEELHRQEALELGAVDLPAGVQRLMRWVSGVMVRVAYYI